jgi:glyoxylase-like metal-dependent hydrolase (beta-lactamase superfamily II)
MIEEIAEGLFRIEIPLPDTTLKFVNSYVVKDTDRNLVIDTGMYNDKCLKTMTESLQKLGVRLKHTDFFITHCHGDHMGLVSRLVDHGSAVFINKTETKLISKILDGSLFEEIRDFLYKSDFPEKEPSKIISPSVKDEFNSRESIPFRFVKEGDVLVKGKYRFKCIETPGHSRGHMCLYDLDSKYLIAGDHLLKNITPGIQARVDDLNPLKEYMASLRKIYLLDITKILPGHRAIFENCSERIIEIEEHHNNRNNEILRVLGKHGRTIYEIASKMSWNVDCDSWDSFPVTQSFFATSETFAHLRYLEETGSVIRSTKEEIAYYKIYS